MFRRLGRQFCLPSAFRQLVSGHRLGVCARLLRGVLRVAEVPYTTAIQLRNRCYNSNMATIHHVSAPVISVGNLTLGGTGKTPMVVWLCHWLSQRGVPVTLVSRGYGTRTDQPNDEALELAEKLPHVPHIQHPDRVRAAQEAIAARPCRLVLLDDGFQHRRLARNLDIVLIDALEPFGFRHLFPRGTLREPLSSLSRADVVVLSRADVVGREQRVKTREEVLRHAPKATWCEFHFTPHHLRQRQGQTVPLSTLKGHRVAAFCGLGNPAGFRHTLGQCGYDVVGFREYPDHYVYHDSDIAWLAEWAADCSAQSLLCTHKDLVKIDPTHLGDVPLWAVAVELNVVLGGGALEARLEQLLARHRLPISH